MVWDLFSPRAAKSIGSQLPPTTSRKFALGKNISALAKPECPRASIARGCSVGCYGSITGWNSVVLTRYKEVELKKRENGNGTSERQLYSIYPLLPRCEPSSLPGAQASQAPLGLARNIGSPITASCSGVSLLSVVSCYSRQLRLPLLSLGYQL